MALTQALGQFIADLSPNRVPEEAVRIARMGFIDCIGTMIVGRNEDCTQILQSVLAPGEGAATLYFSGARSPGPEAGWINGTAATIKVRRYWNEPSRPFIDLAGKQIPYYDPATRTTSIVTPRWVIDHTRFDAESVNDTNYRYAMAALNARFWRDRIILLGAARRDR